MGKVATVVGVLAFGALMAYATSWTVRGWVAAWRWDGTTKLECFGSTVMHLRGKKANVAGTAIEAAGNCELEIENCEISGDPAVFAAGNAKVTLVGGRLEGKKAALAASGGADVEIRGTQLAGRIERSGNARVHGLPEEDAKQAAEDLSRKYGADACAGMIECYTQAGAFGQISGRLTSRVGTDGHMLDATYEGEAKPPIRACLVAAARKRVIAGYDGQPGFLTCEYAGTIAGGSRQLMIGGGYRRAK
jgi:hypothetical protein